MTDSKRKDVFAGIAARGAGCRHAVLVEPVPPELPHRCLPARRSDPRAVFQPGARLDTPDKLQRALARERRRMIPFLRDLAPPPVRSRIVVPIESADWRLETDVDRRDFAATLAGAGRWQRVRLPHYGGPVGRAVAYYRTTFVVTQPMLDRGSLFLCFRGVDYQAHVFMNGALLGAHEGFFAPFDFDFTAHARAGTNTLLVRVTNDAVPISGDGSWGMQVDGDKLYAATGPGWDDPELGWHHCPPGMGIYQPVTVEARPRLHLADLFVRPLLEERKAEVWIEVVNSGALPEGVRFQVSVFGQNFPGTVFRDRSFAPPQKAGPRVNRYRFVFDLPSPRIWELATPWLYQVQVRLDNGDTLCRQFGMRSFRMDTSRKPYGRFFLNGREIRLRGANTMGFEQQDVINGDLDQLRDDILLARICHLNFWRLTQRPVQTEVYDLCNRLGLMTQTDLPLFGYLPRRQFCEAVRQAGEMERLVRNHPCNILVSYINEPYSAAWGDQTHRQCSREELELFFVAADQAVRLANPDRVIKPVDGDYDPPAPGLPDNHCYTCWYNGHGVELGKLHKGFWQPVKPGWLYGCGEFGAEGLDPVALMRRRYPPAWLPRTPAEEAGWSPDRIKESQTGKFHYCFFDTPRALTQWIEASQRHQAWATRTMTEAFRRDNRMNSFAIHLFIDAWPSGWMKAIMDVERTPKPAYFAYREALTPLMANIRTDRWAYTAGEEMRFEFWVCNDTSDVPADARLRYQLEVDGQVVFAQKGRARVGRCRSEFQGCMRLRAPAVSMRTAAVLRLALATPSGKVLHDTAVALTLFPPLPAMPSHLRVAVIGPRRGAAACLARELGLKPAFAVGPDADPRSLRILVDDLPAFRRDEKVIAGLVRRGATVLFLDLPAGRHRLGADRIDVCACGMGARHFVSRDTGHPLVAGFHPEDFRLWYDPAVDRIAPLLETCFHADGWTPILATGNGGLTLEDARPWGPALAAAEKADGAGCWRVCQVGLSGRIATNPAAELLARGLVGLSCNGVEPAAAAGANAAPRVPPAARKGRR